MVRFTHAPGRGRTLVAALALATLALDPQAWARTGGGGGGGHFGGHVAGGFGGGHAGVGARGGFGHGHGGGHFRGAVVIGGLGLWSLYPYPYSPAYAYPYPYPYAYDPAVVPGYNVPPPGQVWYYCDAAAGYYPYVTTCPGPWREVPVPAQPAPGPAQ